MTRSSEYIADFGMDTISLAGPLVAKLRAIREAGFSQVMLAARDLVGHPAGWRAAVAEVRASGLRVTGFDVNGARDLLSNRVQRGDSLRLPAYGAFVLARRSATGSRPR